jgi:TRAP-type C4-dicarboxylate transport system permease small subunit
MASQNPHHYMPVHRKPGGIFYQMDKIKKIIQVIENLLISIAGVMFLIMMFLGVGDVLGRYLFNKPIRGALEISQILMGGIVFLSWAHTQKEKGHVSVDLFIDRYSPKNQTIVTFFALFLSLVFFALIAWQSTEIALKCWQENRVIPTLNISTAPFHFFVPIGAILLCIELVMQMVNLLRETKKG